MPEDADQDIRSRAFCACGGQRGPPELSSHAKVEELSWGLGWQYSFWQSFHRLFFCAGQGNGALRLFRNGETRIEYSSGRVHIYLNNGWGNICDDSSFGDTEADVICHQLGYTGASRHTEPDQDKL